MVVVTAAAGAVGSVVGQIAKLKGCKVIGFAGDDDKIKWLKDVLGFDHAINYKTADNAKALLEVAPDGIDCYFDNVGGELSSIIINQLKVHGRVSLCGLISAYNLELKQWPKIILEPTIVWKQLKIEGFVVSRFWDQWLDGINELYKWVEEGKIKYHETTTNGFEKLPQALIDLLRGKNTGKAIVKV